jgi:hypothetical protein
MKKIELKLTPRAGKDLGKLVNVDGLIQALFAPESSPTQRTVWNWVREGQVPCIHIGRSVFFDPVAVRATLEKRRQRKRQVAK